MFSSLVRHTTRFATGTRALSGVSGFPAPRLFDYETVTSNLSVADAIESVEEAFSALARGKVDVPMPMHIGIEESSAAGPGDCHIKGGYVSGTPTFTVKLACVSFYKNAERGLPPGSGIFIVVNAVTGAPLAVFQENRFMTDCEFNFRSDEGAMESTISISVLIDSNVHIFRITTNRHVQNLVSYLAVAHTIVSH